MRIQNTWLMLVNTLSQTIVVGTAIGIQEKVPLETAEQLAWCHITSSRPDDKFGPYMLELMGITNPAWMSSAPWWGGRSPDFKEEACYRL